MLHKTNRILAVLLSVMTLIYAGISISSAHLIAAIYQFTHKAAPKNFTISNNSSKQYTSDELCHLT
jgi:hypothetical protein